MTNHSRYSIFIILSAMVVFQCCGNSSAGTDAKTGSATIYVCLPCGRDCDSTMLTKKGQCSSCNMQLVKKSSIVFKNILPADLYKHISTAGNSNILLLDVRTREEFEGSAPEKFGRLKNALNIPVQQLEQRINELEAYKEKEVIVYCSHSHRSPAASYLLTQKGFKKVTNMQHGMHAWKQEVNDRTINDSLYISQ